MKAALIVIVVLAALILLLLFVRVGAIVQGDLNGINVTLRFGFLYIPFRKRKTQKKKKAAINAASANVSKQSGDVKPDTEEEETSLSLELIRQYLALAKTVLRQIKKSIRIDRLILMVKVGGKDAATAALKYGSASAAVSMLLPALGDVLELRKTNIAVDADFEGGKDTVQYELRFSGQVVWLLRAVLIVRAEYKKIKIIEVEE